jgi:glucokinase
MVWRPTPAANASLTVEMISDAVKELLARHEVDAVGIGAAGFIEESGSTVVFAPNLAWRNERVARQVEDRTGRPVVVENDANCAAWAEAKLGAGRGHDHVMVITIGTGIGAGIVLNGELYRGRWGMAGEPGHYRVVPDGRLCGCGNRGCWEQYASGSALVAEAREFARRSPGAAVRLLQLSGGTPEGIKGPEVTAAAREGDAAALQCFDIIGRWLGEGLADLAAILDPGCFVLGGGVSEAGDLLLAQTRAAFENGLTGRQYRPHALVVLAELGPEAGMIGAADLARLH